MVVMLLCAILEHQKHFVGMIGGEWYSTHPAISAYILFRSNPNRIGSGLIGLGLDFTRARVPTQALVLVGPLASDVILTS